MSQGTLLLAGCVASCGAVLGLAGLSKLYRAGRGLDGGAAIRRALRLPRRRWRRAELAAGALECLTGTLVCTGTYPVPGSAAMAAFGATFCVLLGYTRSQRIPGDCGCLSWRKTATPATSQITWRALARSAILLAAGLAGAAAPTAPPRAYPGIWFALGVLATALIFVLLSPRPLARTPVCHRRLWRPARSTLRALAAHETFEAMATSAGPFAPVAGHRKDGCTEEFWLSPPSGPAIVFRVSYPAPGAPPAVHAARQDTSAPATPWPTRTLTLPPAPAPNR